MNISEYTKAYLVLDALAPSEKEILKKNIEPMYHFYLAPNAALVATGQNIVPLMDEITAGIEDAGKITFIYVGEQIYTKLRRGNGDFETVFDKQ